MDEICPKPNKHSEDHDDTGEREADKYCIKQVVRPLNRPEALKAVAATPQRLTEDVQAGGASQEALRPIGPIRTAANLRLIRTRRDDPLTTFKTVT